MSSSIITISSDDDWSGSQASPSTIIQSGQLIVDSVHSTVDSSGCRHIPFPGLAVIIV